jgi:hypothetical protein
MKVREQMRHPMLWEAVRTTVPLDPDGPWATPEQALVQHLEYVLINQFRNERVRGGLPGDLLGPVTEPAVEHGVPVLVDGVARDGMRVDTDALVVGLGVAFEDRVLTAVFARAELPYLETTFITRPAAL